MEKTIQYALNEALQSGRRSAMPEFHEAEVREKIAQQLEQFQLHTTYNLDYVKAKMISIVRGHND